MKKLTKQILSFIFLGGFFISLDLSIFAVATNRFINDFGSEMQAKSVEVTKFLPFDSNSGIIKKDGETSRPILMGDIQQLNTYENNVIFGYLTIGQLWNILNYK